MIASTMPRMSDQKMLYGAVLDAANDAPVTFRTLDIGGDKVLPYMRATQEENPALGWRAIRLGLDRPALLRTQLRALMHAAAGRELRVMLPMVTEVSEVRQARTLLDREIAHFRRHGHKEPSAILLGAMVEVPSLLFQLDELMTVADFISVGSNDLMQFMTASDRTNTRVAERFRPLSRPFLRALRKIVDTAHLAGVPVTLCGEMAGRPLTAMALIGLGYRSLSMSPAAIGPVKAMTLELDAGKLTQRLLPLIDSTAPEDAVHDELRAFATAEGVPL
jgi:phosphotransferase system enzyme I (PtsP)